MKYKEKILNRQNISKKKRKKNSRKLAWLRSISVTHIHDRSLSWFGTDTLIKSAGLK